MSQLSKPITAAKDFLTDYCRRHANPVNASLHIFGVPAAFYGLFKLLSGSWREGLFLLFVGYLLQYLGHRAQGNEVGEITLIKKIYHRMRAGDGAAAGGGR